MNRNDFQVRNQLFREFLRIFIGILAGVLVPSIELNAAVMTGVDFKFATGKSRLELATDGAVAFEKTVSEADKQVIIDIKGATVPKMLARKTDTSQFRSNVALISTYQKEGGTDTRVVLQLKDLGDVAVTQEGNKIVALIDNGKAEGEAPPIAEGEQSSTDGAKAKSTDAASVDSGAKASATTTPAADASVSSGEQDTLESFMDSQNTKKYVGSKISIQMMNADLQDIFRIIAKASEFNIMVTDSVKGKMSLDLTDVPWDQALDVVLKANKLSAERIANILRIVPTEELQKEKDIENLAKASVEAAEPLVTKIFPISYAEPVDMKQILTPYLSKSGGQTRGAIEIDKRSNSLVIRETPSTIEKFKRILKELDTQTPQILIEGKFVQVSEQHSKQFEGGIYGTTRFNENGSYGFQGSKNNFGFTANTTIPAGVGTSPPPLGISSNVKGLALGFGPKSAIIPFLPDIQALLDIQVEDSESRVVNSPRVVTQNKQAATISSGSKISQLTSAGVGGAGATSVTDATMNLIVEPQVTNDGSINLKVTFNENAIASIDSSTGRITLNTSSVSSHVLIDSGSTLVIGGVYATSTAISESGIPFLRDIPVLGVFFGAKSTVLKKDELFIFITPRILNEKESGLKT